VKIVKPSYSILYPERYGFEVEARKIERMGRIAYKSEDNMTISSWRGFIRKIVLAGHESCLEHAIMSVLFVCDRGVSHELVRHRLCAFTQESTRYCNYSASKFDGSLTFIEPLWEEWSEKDKRNWREAMLQAEGFYLGMVGYGRAPQEARSVLPNSLKTEIGVTANFREWRHIFRLRAISGKAHPQMRELMVPLYEECREKLPDVFDMGNVE
jgi:thymidylate synthase (FAD)